MTRRVLETVTRVAEPHSDCRTAEQMTEICCEATGALPCCERVETWTGYSDQDFIDKLGLSLDEQGRDAQGRYVVIRRLPRSQPCGEKMTKYDVTPNICCEGVEELTWDAENSAEVIANMSAGVVSVLGGKLPLSVSVYGSGFYLSEFGGLKDGVVDGRSFRIFTSTACGTCKIVVSDGCSTVVGSVKSPNGRWAGELYVNYLAIDYGQRTMYPDKLTIGASENECLVYLPSYVNQPAALTEWYNSRIICQWDFSAEGWVSALTEWSNHYAKVGTEAGDYIAAYKQSAINTLPSAQYPNGPADVIDQGADYCGYLEWVC